MPHLSGIEASKISIQRRGLLGALRIFLAGVHDRLRSWVGLSPEYVKLAGRPGELALMQLDAEELHDYISKQPKMKMVRPTQRLIHCCPDSHFASS